MTKQQILKLTGLTEAEFYKKYPTKDAFYRDYPDAKEKMARGGSLNRDRMRTSTGTPVGAEDYIMPALYGVGEAALGTFVPQAAPLTDALYQGIQAGVNPSEQERRAQNMMRGFGKVGGAAIGVGVDPSKWKNAVGQGISGIASGAGSAATNPITGQIIGSIGSSMMPMLDLIPNKEEKRYGGRMRFDRGGSMAGMGSGVSSTGSLSAPGVDTSQLNADKMKKKKTYLGGAAGVFAGMAAGLGDIIGLGPMIDKVNESEGIETSSEFDISRSVNAAVGGAAAGFFGVGKGASAGEDAFKNKINKESAKNFKKADKMLSEKFDGNFTSGAPIGGNMSGSSGSNIAGTNVPTLPALQRFGGMYRDGGVMNNTSNLGLTDLKGPRHADGGIALNEDVEVEGEETIYTPERYVFSEVMKASKDALKEAGLSPSYEGRSYSSISRSFKNSVDTLRGSEDKLAQRAVDQKLKKLIDAHEYDRSVKRERDSRNVVAQTPEERAGGYNMFPNAESIMFPGQGPANVVPADNQMPIEVTGADGSQQILTNSPVQTQAPFMERKMKKGGKMIKRADGSYSRRGLWDNIRANRGSGRKPTKEMLEQERKIKAEEKAYGGTYNPYLYNDGGYMAGDGSDQPDGSYWRSSDDMTYYMYGGGLKNYPVMQAEGGKLPEGILRSRLESHMSPSEVENYMESYAYGGNLGRTNYDVYVNSPSYFRAEGGSFDNPGFKALPTYVQNKIKSNMQDGGELYMGEMPEYTDMEGYDLDQDEATNYGEGGSYRVYKSNERKGKTHKVVGPGGKVKYFGDPNLGERSKSKYGKKAFYARHRKNLAKNPYFRAYARATWEDGGEFGSPDNNYYFDDASGSYLTAMQQGGMMPMGAPEQAAPSQGNQMQQIMQVVVQMLQQTKDPMKVVQALVQKGMSKEDASQIVQDVLQQMQEAASASKQAGTLGEEQAYENQGMPFQDGGMMMGNYNPQPEMSQEEAKIMQAVAGMLMQGAQPEQVLKQLVKSGIPQETSVSIIQSVMKQMQAESAQQPSSPEQMLGMGQPSEEEMAMAQAQQQGMMAYGGPMQYKKGGIYIKPSKRGSFTAWANRHDMGVQEAARHVMANKEDYSSAIVKKANFAKNAAGWKHAMGGKMMYQQDLGYLPAEGPIGSGAASGAPFEEEVVYPDFTTPVSTDGTPINNRVIGAPFETEQVDYTEPNTIVEPTDYDSRVAKAYQSLRLNNNLNNNLYPTTTYNPKDPEKERVLGTFKLPRKNMGLRTAAAMLPAISTGLSAAFATRQPETPLPKYDRISIRPGQLAIEDEANRAYANTMAGLRVSAPTQGALLANAIGLGSTLYGQSGQLKLRNLMDTMAKNQAIQQAEAAARFEGDMANKTIQQQEKDKIASLANQAASLASKGVLGLESDRIKEQMNEAVLPLLAQGNYEYVPVGKNEYKLVFRKNS